VRSVNIACKRRFQCVNADAPQRASGNNGLASAQKSAEAVNTTSNPTFATKSALSDRTNLHDRMSAIGGIAEEI
jgi:phage/plasmid primase-like uncharacterized protein